MSQITITVEAVGFDELKESLDKANRLAVELSAELDKLKEMKVDVIAKTK